MREIKIPQMISALLVKKGIKQKDLAAHIGVTDNTVSYWCTGARVPNLTQLILISDYFAVSLDSLVFGDNSVNIKICKNCGKQFSPRRSDTEYCNLKSPQEPNLSCSEYNSRRNYYKRLKENDISVLSRNILAAKGMAAKRNPKKKEDYDNFRKERIVQKRKYESGEISPEEYREWLISKKGGT